MGLGLHLSLDVRNVVPPMKQPIYRYITRMKNKLVVWFAALLVLSLFSFAEVSRTASVSGVL